MGEVSTNAGSSWTNVSGATSASYQFTAQLSQNGYEYRAVFTNLVATVDTSAATLTVAYQSSNWSGYAVTGGVFSSVSADSTVPTITCPAASTSYSSQWIGIDGDNSDTVEQDGTEADCASGTPYYGAWYEMYGDANVDGGYEVPLSNPVHAGDAMRATVSLSAGTWTLAIADATQNWHVSTTVASPTPAPAQSSAEWIGERPEVCSSSCGLANLSNFGSFAFTNATATDASATNAPISSFACADRDGRINAAGHSRPARRQRPELYRHLAGERLNRESGSRARWPDPSSAGAVQVGAQVAGRDLRDRLPRRLVGHLRAEALAPGQPSGEVARLAPGQQDAADLGGTVPARPATASAAIASAATSACWDVDAAVLDREIRRVPGRPRRGRLPGPGSADRSE